MDRYERLVMPHQTYLTKYAKKLEKDPGLVEDLVQETLCKAAERLSLLADDKAVKGWLRKIMYNACVDSYRKEKGYTFISLDKFNLDDLPDDIAKHLTASLPDEQRETLWELSLLLPAMDRSILRARCIFGFSFEEIAWNLGVPPDTARKRYERATERLKEICNE